MSYLPHNNIRIAIRRAEASPAGETTARFTHHMTHHHMTGTRIDWHPAVDFWRST